MNHFDAKAAEWDDNPNRREMTLRIAESIRSAVPLEKSMSAMEFGCGTGLLSRELLPMLGKITAIDLSQGMIQQLQKRIDEEQLQKITAHCLDIFTGCPPSQKYNLIFSAMALHHVQDTDRLLDRLTAFTAPNGWIALADLDTEDGTFHEQIDGFVHHGFDRKTLMRKLQSNGFIKLKTMTAHTISKNGRDYPVFLIIGRKISV